jgi:hypothetical protein
MKDEEFKEHVKTLSIEELKEKLDGMIEVYEAYKDDVMLKIFHPDANENMLYRQQLVRQELLLKIEQDLLGE